MSNNLTLINPNAFNSKQAAFFEAKKQAITEINALNLGMICGIKDVNSIHHIATDAYAHCVGLKQGSNVNGKSDFDMPCDGTVMCAQWYVYWDQQSLLSGKTIKTSDCNLYATGLELQIYTKVPVVLDGKVLGLYFYAERQQALPLPVQKLIQIVGNDSFNIVSTDHVYKDKNGFSYKFESKIKLEICYYVMMNYSDKEIANIYQVDHNKVSQIRRYICQKNLNLESSMQALMRDKLESIGFTRTIPASIYQRHFIKSECLS